jgi:hypothetical protein
MNIFYFEIALKMFFPKNSAGHCLLFLECNVLHVKVDFGLLLEGHRVKAEPLEGLNFFLILVNLAVLQVDVLRSKNAV